jgi:hypothetical protein
MIYELLVGRKPIGITVRPDDTWPAMWRVHWPDGQVSDMVNLSRAKDAATLTTNLGWRAVPASERPPVAPVEPAVTSDVSICVHECRDHPGSFEAVLDGETLCRSRQPFITSARILIERGYDPDMVLTMQHAGSNTIALRGRLGAVAKVEVFGTKFLKQRAAA